MKKRMPPLEKLLKALVDPEYAGSVMEKLNDRFWAFIEKE